MTSRIYLSEGQKDKLKSCFGNKTSCKLRLEYGKPANTNINLTQTQINKIEEARKRKKGCDIEISKTQLQQNGGFLPFLAPLIPLAVKALATGAIGALGAKAVQKMTGKGTRIPGKKYGQGTRIPGK